MRVLSVMLNHWNVETRLLFPP